MNTSTNHRVTGPLTTVLVALSVLVAMVASVLVAPPARAQAADPSASDLLRVSKDGDTWSSGPTPAILAWSAPFEGMSPGDSSTQDYYIRNDGSVPVRVDVAVLVASLDEYSYLAGRSAVATVSGTVTDTTTRGEFHLIGAGAAGVDGLTGTTSLPHDTLVSGAELAPGATVRVTNTVTFPSEVDTLSAEVKARFMNQATKAHFVPRASFGDSTATFSVTRSENTPPIVGRRVDFTIAGSPAEAVAGGTAVVYDADGKEIARVPLGADGTGTFTHTFDEPGDHRLTVRFEPTAGQGPVEPVTVQITVAEPGTAPGDPGSPGGPGSSGGSLGNLGWLFAIPVAIGALALLVGGAWYLADRFRVPGIPPFPAPVPDFGGSSGSLGLPVDREDERERQYRGPANGSAGTGGVRADAGQSSPTTGSHAGQVPLPVIGDPDAGQYAPAAPAAQADKPWWERLVDAVRGFFR
ncbi:Ig-like domain-containing protein [Dietzia sp. 179-F 9C3 NHS]|uniref:Ig-like domain-containing protein n=1 Tax=Dietzia sp. 179-F 9C3 NHS TaxID=3374295 RepID=UPI0038799601